MSGVTRFGISLENSLLVNFDRHIRDKKYQNRSEAIRDLIRQELIKEEWKGTSQIAGTVTLIYDHHKRELVTRMLDIQHDFQNIIISTQHVHLDHDNCLEIIAVRGKPKDAQQLADLLKAQKGVKHATICLTSTGKNII